jgi:uncharacterized protein
VPASTSTAGPGNDTADAPAASGPARSSAQSQLGQLLARANPLEIGTEINSAGRRLNVHEIEVFTQKGVYARRIMDALGLAPLQQEIGKLASSTETADQQLAQNLSQRRD